MSKHSAPTWLLKVQAARVLGVSPALVAYHARKGGAMEGRTWYGSFMIPAQKVYAFRLELVRKRARIPVGSIPWDDLASFYDEALDIGDNQRAQAIRERMSEGVG